MQRGRWFLSPRSPEFRCGGWPARVHCSPPRRSARLRSRPYCRREVAGPARPWSVAGRLRSDGTLARSSRPYHGSPSMVLLLAKRFGGSCGRRSERGSTSAGPPRRACTRWPRASGRQAMPYGSGRKPTCGASRGRVSTSGTCANGLCRFESFLGGGCSSGGAGDSLLSQHPIQEVAQADPGSIEPGPNDGHVLFQVGTRDVCWR